jgi:Cft2 family RNA processing exonuclease
MTWRADDGDEQQAIFFVVTPTRIRRVGGSRTPHGETFLFSGGGEGTRNCQMEDFDLTAHANRDELLDFVGQVEPRAVVLGMGRMLELVRGATARHPKIR